MPASSLIKSRLANSLLQTGETADVKEQCHICGKTFGMTRKRRTCGHCGQTVCPTDSLGSSSTCLCNLCRSEQVYERVAAVAEPLVNKRHTKLHEMLANQKAAQQKVESLRERASITEALNISVAEQFDTQLRHSQASLEQAQKKTQELEAELAQLEKTLEQHSQQKSQLASLQEEKETLHCETAQVVDTIRSLEADHAELTKSLASVLLHRELKALLCRRCWRQVQTQGQQILHRSAPLCMKDAACGSCCVI